MNRVFFGDCRDVMRQMIADGVKVQTCVTSPPYWGLRDYGHPGQLGLEASPEESIANMVEVFDLVRNLLADDGTLWLNMGDSYAGSRPGSESGGTLDGSRLNQDQIRKAKRLMTASRRRDDEVIPRSDIRVEGLKPKDLVGIPWMLAFALRASGWYLRQDIIWSKPNPMPESVRDRCTKAHEHLFLMAKSSRYYFDADAIAEPISETSVARLSQPNLDNQQGSDRIPGKTNGAMKAVVRKSGNKERKPRPGSPDCHQGAQAGSIPWEGATRNKRSVWTVATAPYKEAHFATFPPALIEPCILAGSRPGDIVFDPFFGSGTTGQVAEALGRQWIGCEINEQYAPLQKVRLAQRSLTL